jgi:2-C-methyl-D-erythritol 2,4-cyclodiphosphate synthase
MNIRVGQGFDLHRLVEGRPLKIGGVLVDHPKGSLGHSDGDAVLHAVIDALLGAAGLGDVGDHFPPSDPQYKDIDSRLLLQKTVALILANHWRPVNVDVTVLLEAPKLYPYKQHIRETMGKDLQMAVESVSLKAKTTEGLGAIGRGEAYGAMVVALLEKF